MSENDKTIQELITYIEEGQKRIDSAKTKLVSLSTDFDIWAKYSIDKTQYPYVLGMTSPLMILLEDYCEELFERRYTVIDLEWVLEILNNLLREGFITEVEVEDMKKYLQKINFGSMTIDW